MRSESNKELELLSLLRQDSRMRLTEISKKTGIPVSTIFERMKSYDQQFISKYTCLLNYDSIGYSTRVSILLKVGKDERNGVAQHLKKKQNVNSIYRVNNGFDFIVEALFMNIMELNEFCEDIEDKFRVKSIQVHYIVEELKREGFLSDPKTAMLIPSRIQKKPVLAKEIS
ncbi:Lrp/AsnC family transcriptional regulator [Candidatus Woesearchaeota archaeon]|nr:Lrp/AsnC family transcriptional regulator [Candidatus Woesearchaeota archaeon]